MRQLFVWPLLTLAAAGCGSIRTTPLDRTEADTYVVNPHHPICGVPVMLRVPTHLKVAVIEKRYWSVCATDATLKPLQAKRPILDVEHNLEYTEKMFVVDPVKPLSGDQAYGFTYAGTDEDHPNRNGKGYLSGMRYKSVDTSIVDSAALIGTALKRFAPPKADAAFADTKEDSKPVQNVIITTRVIAFRRFDVNAPDLEHAVTVFLCSHLNHACNHSGCPVNAISGETECLPAPAAAPAAAPTAAPPAPKATATGTKP
jgi:hypothetical protein